MNTKMNLLGKTISGIVAVQEQDDEPVKIWMLQFTDGSHVEFVSPNAKRRISLAARRVKRRSTSRADEPQLALNVA